MAHVKMVRSWFGNFRALLVAYNSTTESIVAYNAAHVGNQPLTPAQVTEFQATQTIVQNLLAATRPR